METVRLFGIGTSMIGIVFAVGMIGWLLLLRQENALLKHGAAAGRVSAGTLQKWL